MEWLAGSRVALTPRPADRQTAALDVAMLGHCPGRVRLERLVKLTAALDEMRAIGYGETVDKLLLIDALDHVLRSDVVDKIIQGGTVDNLVLLESLQALLQDKAINEVKAGVDELLKGNLVDEIKLADAARELVDKWVSGGYRALYQLPVPLRSSAEFHDIFPDAVEVPAEYESVLAGKRAWLGFAVDDFFANGGEKLWVVRIAEADGRDGFVPAENTELHDISSLRGLATVLVNPSLGLLVFPDLERLQIPSRLPDIPEISLNNPQPQFLPCTEDLNNSYSGSSVPAEERAKIGEPWSLQDLLQRILRFIVRYRSDVQCLFTLPLSYSGALDSPVIDRQALDMLSDYKKNPGEAQALRHVQFLFPYLRGPRFKLHTAAGLIAGQQAATIRRDGPWRSMAAQPLNSDALPYPRLSNAQVLQLREEPGISVINHHQSPGGQIRLSLDDERLAVPALLAADYPFDKQRYDGFRSAEVMRFLGFLRRQLQALGEQLIFNLDYRDPRPRLLLEQFFRRLHARGALRGALPEQAFTITESQPQEGAMLYEIMLAPAFPVDRLFLTFANLNGEWHAEVVDG